MGNIVEEVSLYRMQPAIHALIIPSERNHDRESSLTWHLHMQRYATFTSYLAQGHEYL